MYHRHSCQRCLWMNTPHMSYVEEELTRARQALEKIIEINNQEKKLLHEIIKIHEEALHQLTNSFVTP